VRGAFDRNLDCSTQRRLEVGAKFERDSTPPIAINVSQRSKGGWPLFDPRFCGTNAGSDIRLHLVEDDTFISRHASVAITAVALDSAYEALDIVFTSDRSWAFLGTMTHLIDIFDRSVEARRQVSPRELMRQPTAASGAPAVGVRLRRPYRRLHVLLRREAVWSTESGCSGSTARSG
jgi:hypothetical protein